MLITRIIQSFCICLLILDVIVRHHFDLIVSFCHFNCSGVIQTWHQEGRQYWKRFAMDEISVTAEHSEISSHPNTRHDAPLR